MTKFTIPHLIGGPRDGEPLPQLLVGDTMLSYAGAGTVGAHTDVYLRVQFNGIMGWVFDDPNDWDGPNIQHLVFDALIELAKKGAGTPALKDNASSVYGYPAELVLRMQDGPLVMPLPVRAGPDEDWHPTFDFSAVGDAILAWQKAGKR